MSLAYKNESVSLSLASPLDGAKRSWHSSTSQPDMTVDMNAGLGYRTWRHDKMIPIGCHSSDERHHFADFALDSAAQVHVSCLSVTKFDLLDDDRAA